MIEENMWCKSCNIETDDDICPICGAKTVQDTPIEVHWCGNCNVPIINLANQSNKGVCPVCGKKTKYISTDLRPVFPEERLLIELLLGLKPNEWREKSVWACNSRYFVDGKATMLSTSLFQTADTDSLAAQLKTYESENSYEWFDRYIQTFIAANKYRLEYIVDEAYRFIRESAADYPRENLVISFSGGKDSTVTADLVLKALSDPSIVHVFGDTTLEFPMTVEYVNAYRKDHPFAIFQIAKNDEQNFMDVCDEIGPPARMMRWCCSMFKTGPITRVLNGLYRNQQILTFYGIRKVESVSRSKYNRVESDAESVKIQKQTVASPIFFWRDIDIWLYILTEKIDFNGACRLGYDRIGCWCCPNNNQRAQFLSKIYMPEKSREWRDFLIGFAKRIGKPDAENYVDSGKWKARQGGNGVAAADDVKIKFTNCTAEDHAKIYKLNKPYGDALVNLFVPFGRLAPEFGRKILNETLILDVKTNVPIISVQPFSQDGYEYAVKVKTMNVADHDDLQRKIGYQIRKYNACRGCLKCESLCRAGAISIVGTDYYINPAKCVHCKMCVTAKYLDGGCMMERYLRTK